MSSLASTNLSNIQDGRVYNLRLDVFKNQLDGYVDGSHRISYTLTPEELSDYQGAMKQGVFHTFSSDSGVFNNIKWKSLG